MEGINQFPSFHGKQNSFHDDIDCWKAAATTQPCRKDKLHHFHCWKQQDRPEGWPILCGTISPEKGKSKKSFGQPTLSCNYSHPFTSCNGPLSSSLPCSTGEELRRVWSSPRQTQLIWLGRPPKTVFPGMWSKLVKTYELHCLHQQMLENLLVFATHTTKSMAEKSPEFCSWFISDHVFCNHQVVLGCLQSAAHLLR